MWYVKGQYKRDLPKAEPSPGDVFVSETWYGPKSSIYYVADAFRTSPDAETVHLSQGHDSRVRATAEAWRVLAQHGHGRLLVHQRYMVEVPIRWVLSFRPDVDPESRLTYARGTTGERHLATALRHWADLPDRVGLYFARAIVAKGYQGATLPLSQTETRAALRFDPATLRPMAREAFGLLSVQPLALIPDVLKVRLTDADLTATGTTGGPSCLLPTRETPRSAA